MRWNYSQFTLINEKKINLGASILKRTNYLQHTAWCTGQQGATLHIWQGCCSLPPAQCSPPVVSLLEQAALLSCPSDNILNHADSETVCL